MTSKQSTHLSQHSGFFGAARLVIHTVCSYPVLTVLPLAFGGAVAILIRLADSLIPIARATENLPTTEPTRTLALWMIDATAFSPIAILTPIFIVTAATAVKTHWQYPQPTPGMFSFELTRQWLRSIGLLLMTAFYAVPLALVISAGIFGSQFVDKFQFGNAIDLSLIAIAATSIILTVLLLILRIIVTPFIAVANNLPIGQSFATATFVVSRRLSALVIALSLNVVLIFGVMDCVNILSVNSKFLFAVYLAALSYILWGCAAFIQAIVLQALDDLSVKTMNLMRPNFRPEEPRLSSAIIHNESGKIGPPQVAVSCEYSDEMPDNFLKEMRN